MKLKIQIKLLLYILLAVLAVFIVSTSYLNHRATVTNEAAVKKLIRENENNSSLKIRYTLNSDISALRALASTVSGTEILTENTRLEIYKSAANMFLQNNPDFENIKISWELGIIDAEWTKNFGRRVYSFERGDGSTIYSVQDFNKDGDDFSSNYYRAKINGKEQITGIVSEDPENPNIKPIYKSTISIPVLDAENNFYALVSGDLEVEVFNSLVKNSASYESFVSFLLTDNAQFAGTSITESEKIKTDLMKTVAGAFHEIRAKIDSAGFASFPITDSLGRKIMLCGTGVENAIFDDKWILVSAIPQEIINAQANSQTSATVFIILIGLVIIGIFILSLTTNIANFLWKAGEILNQLSVGNFQAVSKIEENQTEELNTIAQSLNNLKNGLDKAVIFAEEIGKGNLEANFVPISENDELGSSLLSMRESLKKANAEATERRELDRKQNWITEGTAKFGAILREYNNDMFEFSFNIISNLVKYIDANQGGLFVVNDDNKDDIFFELTAGYAYNIRKILKKKVQPGVGLIGRCILESESIYISNLPEDYINITSGLGEKSPQYLLIVPFKFNNEIYAVAEIASFNAIEPYKQQFVEEVGNSIASTIATVKINIRTNKLLQELKVQSEELSSQEEEMRQNMEVMKATQEDMTKKADEFAQTNEALNQVIMLTEFSPEGVMINVNTKAMGFYKKNKQELINNSEKPYTIVSSSENTEIDEFWLQLRLGRQKKISKTVKIAEENYNIIETYCPVQNYYGKIYKVICLTDTLGVNIIAEPPSSSPATEKQTNSNFDNIGGEFF